MKSLFNKFPEREQYKHIYEEMHPVCMEKTVRKKTVPLVAMSYIIRIEFKLIEKTFIPQAKDGNNAGNSNDKITNFHGFLSSVLSYNLFLILKYCAE